MILARAPLRISFVGGGSDLPSFCNRERGAVVSTAISLYTYIAVNRKFDGSVRVSYSRTENVAAGEYVKHSIVREAMKLLGVRTGVELVSVSDVPGNGTGLGSSSAYAVAALLGLSAFQGNALEARTLAEGACEIEIDRLRKPIGRQDQWISALGGIQYMEFEGKEVKARQLVLEAATWDHLQDGLMMFWTGIGRDSDALLGRQKHAIRYDKGTFHAVRQMAELADHLAAALLADDPDAVGQAMAENWGRKRSLAKGISNTVIDRWYQLAIDAGAVGGKLLGAGGGGFLLFYVRPEQQPAVERAVGLPRVRFVIGSPGASLVYDDRPERQWN